CCRKASPRVAAGAVLICIMMPSIGACAGGAARACRRSPTAAPFLIPGTLNEDFAIESLAGDIFQLGNNSYEIRRVGTGEVRVLDAHGQPPSIPFWLGEAPGRSAELSQSVSRLRHEIAEKFDESDGHADEDVP